MTSSDQAELARALFEEIGDALFLLDPDSDRLIEVNPVVLRLTGFTRPEVLRFPATYLFRFEPAGGLQRLRGAFTKTMVFHNQDGYLLRTKEDGVWIPVNLTVSRLHVAPRPLGLIIARDDRDRRAAFAQARRVEAELRKVLSSSPAALWSAERTPGPDVLAGWQFRYVSPLLARIAGRPTDYLDHPFRWAEAVHPHDRDEYRSAVRRLLTGPEAETEQSYRVSALDGTVRWVRDRLQVVRDESGRPVRLDGCLVDTTAQRQAEEALRQSEQRFRALVEKSRDGVVLIDAQGTITYVSPASRSVSGYDPAGLLGTDAFEQVHPGDRAAARDRLRYALAHPGEDVPWQCLGYDAHGAERVYELNLSNRLDDPSVRAVVVNYRDVTEREHATAELARRNALLGGLFDSIPDVICYKDRDLKFLGGNPAFEELAGRPMAEMVGLGCEDVFQDEWAARLRAAEREVLASGKTLPTRDWVTYPDGRKALLDILLSPLADHEGRPMGLIVIGRDVTEQDRLEEHLRQAQKMDAVGQLAGGIAHDFNNLLTVVLGNLEVVRSGGVVGAERDECLAAAERAARQAADLTRQLLGFSRRQPLRPIAVDLNALVRDEVGLLRRTIDQRVVIAFRPAADLRPVVADPVQVQQVVMNLCLNARDAMPDGGTLTIETAPADGAPGELPFGEYARLSVSDTGVGMTEEVRARIFEPFFTTKEVGKGTGLGLATVYGILRAHGGTAVCTSAPGKGTRFDVYLPCGSAVPASAESRRESPAAAAPGGGQTVLVADDEPGIRELARLTLDGLGYRVLTAADGAEAVDVYRRAAGSVGVVVLDASMPVMSGRQAFESIRGLDPSARVIFASGSLGGELDGSDTRVGFLGKPYTPSDLADAVRRMLDATAEPAG